MRKQIERYVQLRNPISKQYVKVDTKTGQIVGHKDTPYKGVPLYKRDGN